MGVVRTGWRVVGSIARKGTRVAGRPVLGIGVRLARAGRLVRICVLVLDPDFLVDLSEPVFLCDLVCSLPSSPASESRL